MSFRMKFQNAPAGEKYLQEGLPTDKEGMVRCVITEKGNGQESADWDQCEINQKMYMGLMHTNGDTTEVYGNTRATEEETDTLFDT